MRTRRHPTLDVDTPVGGVRFAYDGETSDDLQRAHDEREAHGGCSHETAATS